MTKKEIENKLGKILKGWVGTSLSISECKQFVGDVIIYSEEYANQQSKSKDLEILELEKAIEIHEEGYLILDKEYEKLKSTIKNK